MDKNKITIAQTPMVPVENIARIMRKNGIKDVVIDKKVATGTIVNPEGLRTRALHLWRQGLIEKLVKDMNGVRSFYLKQLRAKAGSWR